MTKLKEHILNIQMGGENMLENDAVRLPEIIVFAGPNGSEILQFWLSKSPI